MLLSTLENKELKTKVYDRALNESYDVIVVGLGTAGAIAAITAGRKRLKVLGIESMNCMGGVCTAAGIPGYYYGSKGGLYEEIDQKTAELTGLGYTKARGINQELKKLILEQEAIKAGVMVEYESTLIGVFMEGKRIVGIRWISPKGVKEAAAKIVIDATGEGTVCVMAGCETGRGREIDGGAQPYSNGIMVLEGDVVRGRSTDCGYVDQRDPDSLTEAVLYSGTLPLHLRDDYTEGDRLLYVAPQLGVREGRYIVGEVDLRFSDYLEGKVSNEPVYYAYANLDNHGKDMSFENSLQKDWIMTAGLWGLVSSVPVPLGALIPKGYEGILCVGRAIAADHDLQNFIRMKRDAQKSGEAAANAAYLSIKHNIPLKEVNYEELKKLLMETGCINEEYKDKMEMMRVSTQKESLKKAKWLDNLDDVLKGLSSDEAGIAIWSAVRCKEKFKKELEFYIENSDDINFKRNTALALGLMGSEKAIPFLTQMVKERDTYISKTSRIYNQMRGVAAIYLLGKFKFAPIIPELLNIISYPESFDNINIEYNEFIGNHDELYFQFFAASLMSLMQIGKEHKEHRDLIKRTINDVLNNDNLKLLITLKDDKNLIYDMKEKVKYIVKAMGY